MSTVNILAREVAAKIVFYGPGLSGKTTTLKKIHESVKPAHRGELMSLPTEADRTLFFDFLPVKVEQVGNCAVRLALYTVPGQVFYNATRKLVLQGADGVVFVADSQPEAMDANAESMRNLEENLLEQGIRLDQFPLVLQYNKRDLEKAVPVERLRSLLNPRAVAEFETCATSGRGVLDALKAITRAVIRDLRAKRVVPAPRSEAAAAPALDAPKVGLEDKIQQILEAASHPPTSPPASSNVTPTSSSSIPAAPASTRRSEAPPVAGRLPLGPASALAPGALLDYARAADMAYICADHAGCVRSCQEAVRRALAYTGESTAAAQGYLLGVDGADLLRLERLSTQPHLRPDDGAFALYVVMQVFVRLSAAGLPQAE
ncbi:MAG: GTP-binding protein [Myxococcales bacterium]|nr:GTP-binding protein [Myxococcales bacterium]